MRSIITLLFLAIVTLSACQQHLCPTYSDSGAKRNYHNSGGHHHSPNHHP